MNRTFDRLYRQLGRATFGMLVATLASYGVTLLCALLGFSHGAASLGGATASLAYVFVVLLGVFLVGSVVASVVRWVDRRNQSKSAA